MLSYQDSNFLFQKTTRKTFPQFIVETEGKWTVNVGISSAVWMSLVCVHQDKTSKHKLVEVASCSSAPRCKNVFYIDAQHVFLAASHLSQKCLIGSNGITFPLGYARKRMGYEIDFYCWFGFFC